MREQVEERLRFYDTGEAPRKNVDCMKEVMHEHAALTQPQPQRSPQPYPYP